MLAVWSLSCRGIEATADILSFEAPWKHESYDTESGGLDPFTDGHPVDDIRAITR